MEMKEEFGSLIDRLKAERDRIKLQAHLATMEAREEIEAAEEKWNQLKEKASQIADDTIDTSEEFIAKARIVGEELKETYKRIAQRLSE